LVPLYRNAPPALNWGLPLRTDIDFKAHAKDCKAVFDAAYKASKSLNVIDPDNKTGNVETINSAKDAIRKAKCVYILGYGFDKSNNTRLDLENTLHE
jgi:hypothetical protein